MCIRDREYIVLASLCQRNPKESFTKLLKTKIFKTSKITYKKARFNGPKALKLICNNAENLTVSPIKKQAGTSYIRFYSKKTVHQNHSNRVFLITDFQDEE